MGDDLVIRLSNLHTIEVIDSYKKGAGQALLTLPMAYKKIVRGSSMLTRRDAGIIRTSLLMALK